MRKHRTTICNCTSDNLEIPGLVLTHHPGITEAEQPSHASKPKRPAPSIYPLPPFLSAERPSAFPRPYLKFSAGPARRDVVPSATARVYYVAMQPPAGPAFLSVPFDDWPPPAAPLEARSVSREIGP